MSVAPRVSRTSAGRLGLGLLGALPAGLAPRVDPRAVGVGIVHLGIGAFHRAHQAVCTEDAIAAAGGDWGICGVTERSRAVVDQLAPQDGLYTLVVRDGAGERLRVVGSVREVRWARADAERLLERIAAPATRVVTLTVTEKGYHHDPATNRLRADSPEIADDLADGGTRTVLGQLVAGLNRRREAHGAPVSVVCCDNLPHNGPVVAGLVREFAGRRGDERLLSWLEESVRFPSTMVDRITPATTAADRTRVADVLGVRDEGAVVTEPFSQWVIEDDFAAARPAWELGGATLTADVRPYEYIKLRMLNGSHSTLAYLGILAGYEYAADAAGGDRPLGGLLRSLMRAEVAPTLDVPPGFDLHAYAEDVLVRFANPALRHRLAQICMDGSQKLPQRLLGTIRDRRRAGAEPVIAALGVAAWMRFVSARRSDGGRELVVEDPLADEIADRLAGREAPEQVVDALLSLRQVFDAELAGDKVLRDLLVDHLRRLARDGAERTIRGMAG
ncbi:MAG TPA: mannitol dehydrogenase family protein [Solirubrobacteraceae bacterium]|nr:mannitol dehydrogenase family protein [Solirubrobacteraceae bacterium]